MPLLPTPWPADPVEGQPGHFDHTLWVKASLIALDNGKVDKPGTGVPAGKLLATTGTDTWSAVDPTSVGGVPRGVIVMWNGTTAPSGWALCDGTQGTPDLQDKFILGWVKGSSAPGSTGGAKTVRLTSAQSGVAAHTHTMLDAAANHSHNIEYSKVHHGHMLHENGGHNHSLSGDDTVIRKGDGTFFRRITGGASGVFDATGGVGNHNHQLDAWLPQGTFNALANDATHKHTINNATAADASQPHDNMPPYYVLAYIMKL